MLSKFLDPKNDVAFKKIFGTEKNKDILIHFLNDMLVFKHKESDPTPRITDVVFLKTVQDPVIAIKKTSIVDVMCIDQNKNNYIVEMQVASGDYFVKRAQYYAAKTYSSQLNVGGKYYDLKEVIFLAIANYTMFPNKQAYKSDHIILDKNSLEHDLKDFSFTFLELEKFRLKIEELTTVIEKWAYFFKHAPETRVEELEKIIGSDTIIQRAYEELRKFSWDEQELLNYEEVEKNDRDWDAGMSCRYREGRAEGLTEGRAEGLEKGLMQGKECTKVEVAKNLKSLGVSMEMIIQATGLQKEEVEKL